jgi:D-threo-aldose 1-dehydrogenase
METRPLRVPSGVLDLTVLGFGGAPLGNLYVAISDEDAEATVAAAWDAGIRFYDTAPPYGFGLSEERLGRALAGLPREEFVLCTKVGRVLEDCRPDEVPDLNFVDTPSRTFRYDYSYDGVMRSHEESLKRLNQDRVEILLVHDADAYTHGSREAADARVRELFNAGGYRALSELRSAGSVSAIGAGVNEWQVCERLLGLADFDCFLLAGRHTLLEHGALPSLLPMCEERGVGVIIGGPFNSGILATGAVQGARYDYGTPPPKILSRVARIEAVCLAHDVQLAAVALQFVLAHPAITTVIPGANAPGQVAGNLTLLQAEVPPALWADLKDAGLLPRHAPTPPL